MSFSFVAQQVVRGGEDPRRGAPDATAKTARCSLLCGASEVKFFSNRKMAAQVLDLHRSRRLLRATCV
jgi:hypothetical protein